MDSTSITGRGAMLDNGTFIFPRDTDLTGPDIRDFIARNSTLADDYKAKMSMYVGDHDVLHKGWKDRGPDNRLVANLPHYIVDTYNGFFTGIPAKITFDDDDQVNAELQNWNQANSVQDKISELSKQVDIYGRSYAFCYMDEEASPSLAFAAPTEAFMVYDDTVAQRPLAFVRYWYSTKQVLNADIYTDNAVYKLTGDSYTEQEGGNKFGVVPAVEFYANEERQGVIDNVATLVNSLDKVLSQKANQIEYFDNAYLKILGLNADADGDGQPDLDLSNDQVIYSGDKDAPNAVIDFIQKPDGDNMQEHMIDRLVTMIHQIAMVPNLNDEAFGGNASGVALQYKLLSMRNMASNKERKFTQSLRQLYRVIFAVEALQVKPEAWQDLHFNFPRNLPANLADEAQTASTLSGIVSKKTQLKVLSIVDDPAQELEQMQEENEKAAKQAQEIAGTLPDYLKEDQAGMAEKPADEPVDDKAGDDDGKQ